MAGKARQTTNPDEVSTPQKAVNTVSDTVNPDDETMQAKEETQINSGSNDNTIDELLGSTSSDRDPPVKDDDVVSAPREDQSENIEDDEDPVEKFDRESKTDMAGGYAFYADPVPLYRVPDLVNAAQMDAYMRSNYGVGVQIIPPGYEATLSRLPEEQEEETEDTDEETVDGAESDTQ